MLQATPSDNSQTRTKDGSQGSSEKAAGPEVSKQSPGTEKTVSLPSRKFLKDFDQAERSRFLKVAHEMSFDEYLDQVFQNPQKHIRNSPQYTVDAMESFGFERKNILGSDILDFNFKNWPWQPQETREKKLLAGQEIPTFEFYQLNKLFARLSHPNRMVVFHGPPGSGKTLLAETIDALLEDYSRNNPEGALYRLIWVFRDEKELRSIASVLSLHEIQKTQTQSDRLVIRPHGNTDPVFLVPSQFSSPIAGQAINTNSRSELLGTLKKLKLVNSDFNTDYFLTGELDSLSERIYEALLAYYKGDMARVRSHARVERWTYSAKAGRGLISIRPNPDRSAVSEPLYPHQSLQYSQEPNQLSDAARDLTLVRGALLSTNRGHMHFADLFRPNQHDRSADDLSRVNHLLETIEGGKTQIMGASDPASVITEQVNTIIRSDSNDQHIEEKRQGSAWNAFRQRLRFITVGLATRFREEARAHSDLLNTLLGERQATPHALNTFALFVTATRLLKPNHEHFEKIHKDLPNVIKKLTVVEKALLFQEKTEFHSAERMNLLRDGSDKLKADEISLLKRHIKALAGEYDPGVGETRFTLYDGGAGISTRAAQDLLRRMVTIKASEAFTIVEVVETLRDQLEGGFEYYQEIYEQKRQLRQHLANDRREKEARAGRQPGKDFDAKMARELTAEIDALYPFPDPKDIVSQVELYARRKVEDDIYDAIGVSSSDNTTTLLLRYIENVRASIDETLVQESLRTSQLGDGRPDEPFMRDFEDNIASDTGLTTDYSRKAWRAERLNQLGVWMFENPGKDPKQHLEVIYPKLSSDIENKRRQSMKKALREFVEATRVYADDPSQLEKDKIGDAVRQQRAESWEKAVERMIKLGYPPATIAKHVFWAIDPAILRD